MASKKMIDAITLMVTTNLTQREIADELSVNESTISRWKKRDDFKKARDSIQGDYLESLTAPAMRTMKSLLNATSELVSYNAAKDILDRNGYKATEKQEISITPTIISGENDLDD